MTREERRLIRGEMIPAKQVAELLHLKLDAVYASKVLRSTKIGGRRLFFRQQIDDLLLANMTPPPTDEAA